MKKLRHGEITGGAIAFVLIMTAAIVLVSGARAVSILLGCLSLLGLVWRAWEFNTEIGSLVVSRSFFGIPLGHRTYLLEQIDRVIVEPAGEGMVRIGIGNGQMVSVACGKEKVQLMLIRSDAEKKAILQSLRKILPRVARFERKDVYIIDRD